MKTHEIDNIRSYVHFGLGNEHFAIIVNRVLEILHLGQLTRVPNASAYIKGILNFRGSIVPVINLYKRFNFTEHVSEGNMVIIVEAQYKDNVALMGLLVEEVADVIDFEYKNLRTVPEIGVKYNPSFLEGFVEMDGKFIMVLNVDEVLNVNELAEIKDISEVTDSLLEPLN
jgi:purine-binding chemotaxis protein CheW